jgi:hypothetical protein
MGVEGGTDSGQVRSSHDRIAAHQVLLLVSGGVRNRRFGLRPELLLTGDVHVAPILSYANVLHDQGTPFDWAPLKD